MRPNWRLHGTLLVIALGITMAAADTQKPTASTQQPQPRAPQALGTPASPPAAPATQPDDIRDIRAVKHLPWIWPWFWATCAACATAIVCWLVWRRWYSRRPSAPSPRDIALERLDAARRWLAPDHAREFSYEVSEAIRAYIESRFHILAPRETTEEFLRDILGSPDPALFEHRAALVDFLGHCDLAKYAGWRFAVPEMESMHASARAFVMVTSEEQSREAGASPVADGSPDPAPVAVGGAA